MESSLVNKTRKKINRAIRVRKHIRGTSNKPRLSVMKSNQHIAVQIIDDEKAITLASASTLMKEFRSKKLGRTKEAAKQIGAKIAELAKAQDIEAVVFDRGHNKFHGLIAELANAARANGLQF